MICGSETTAVTEHICSKMRQLFHELRSVLNSESTTCFTDGHKRYDAALPAACPFAHIHTATTVVIPNFCSFCDTHKGKFLNSPVYVFFRDIYKWTLATNVKNQLVGKAIRACGSLMTL